MGYDFSALFQHDIANDIRDDYLDYMQKGYSIDEAVLLLSDEYDLPLEDDDDAPRIWFALAATQLEYGEVSSMVLENARAWIDRILRNSNDPEYSCFSKELLSALEERLNQHKRKPGTRKHKKNNRSRLYKCPWQIGDVYAYPMRSESAKETGLSGKYLLFHKVGETKIYPGHILPVVRVKIADPDALPGNIVDFCNLDYVKTGEPTGDLDFFFLKKHAPSEIDQTKTKFQYRIALDNTVPSEVPETLVYVDHYDDVPSPQDEYLPPEDIYIASWTWPVFENIFPKIIKRMNPELL